MTKLEETIDQSAPRVEPKSPGAIAGIVTVFTGDAPCFTARAVARDARVTIGRDGDCTIALDDGRASRRHATIARTTSGWRIEDHGSHNGTFVDGARATESVEAEDAVVAIGNTVILLVEDLRVLDGGIESRGDAILGPAMRAAWSTIERLAVSGDVLHVVGETGTGKELAARHYHAKRRPRGPFVAVNCAAVPPLLAEGLLFGAKKGAYSGAEVDSDGYLAAADGGVLFLDEIGELPLEIQAKLLRALETHEVTPLGATKPRAIDLSTCSATHVELRGAIARGTFREDLYFRIASPAVELPPLRERREEIPWLVTAALRATPVHAHASFVEAAMLRPWPGNVRELLRAVANAAALVAPGETVVKMTDLAADAGSPFAESDRSDRANERVIEALRAERGNVTRAAKRLGIHRNQLRRFVEKAAIDPARWKPEL